MGQSRPPICVFLFFSHKCDKYTYFYTIKNFFAIFKVSIFLQMTDEDENEWSSSIIKGFSFEENDEVIQIAFALFRFTQQVVGFQISKKYLILKEPS